MIVGHYAQLVRATASTIGCAVATGCARNADDWMTYVVCHYDYGNRYREWPYFNLFVFNIVQEMESKYPVSKGIYNLFTIFI